MLSIEDVQQVVLTILAAASCGNLGSFVIVIVLVLETSTYLMLLLMKLLIFTLILLFRALLGYFFGEEDMKIVFI